MLALSALGGVLVTSGAGTSAKSTRLALGVNLDDFPGRASDIDDYTRLVGGSPSIIVWYQTFGEELLSFPVLREVDQRGAVPLVTWEPWRGDGESDPSFRLRDIARGDHDDYLVRSARSAALWRKRIMVRFAHEMNGDWYAWGRGVNGNSAADYRAAWRRVVRIFRREGATNVTWVWSPNIDTGRYPFEDLYPGDAFVDWVALDGYNQRSHDPDGRWRSFSQLFGASYDRLADLTSKPMMIGETASEEEGGSKADWITEGLRETIPRRLPRIRAVVWFHRDDDVDFRVNSSADALSAFRRVVRANAGARPRPLRPARR